MILVDYHHHSSYCISSEDISDHSSPLSLLSASHFQLILSLLNNVQLLNGLHTGLAIRKALSLIKYKQRDNINNINIDIFYYIKSFGGIEDEIGLWMISETKL